MTPLGQLPVALRATVDEWMRTRWTDLQFSNVRTTLLVFAALAAHPPGART
jgi:hypothetical protein